VKIIVVGAGMAGLACARSLAQAGHAVTLLDKGRGAGGRMAARSVATPLGEVTFDHGAQYFTARDPAFEAEVQRWAALGLVARWPAAGDDAWVGIPTMNAPLKALAEGLDVRWNTRVDRLSNGRDGWVLATDQDAQFSADAVIVALPSEQATVLLDPVARDMAERAGSVVSRPCWTVMLAFSERLPGRDDCLRGTEDAALGWAARNSAKPGRTGPEAWVVQAGPVWSARNLEEATERVEMALSEALSLRLGAVLPEPIARFAHRWRYARSGVEDSGWLWDPALRLGTCGDWLVGPRVEGAWLSGARLAEQVGRRSLYRRNRGPEGQSAGSGRSPPDRRNGSSSTPVQGRK